MAAPEFATDAQFLLTISQLDGPDGEPRPIFASSDPRLIAAVADHLALRLGRRPPQLPRPLRPVPE